MQPTLAHASEQLFSSRPRWCCSESVSLRPWHKPPSAEGAAWRNAARRSANRSGPSTCSSEAPGSATTAVKASCPHSDSACGTLSPRRARKFVRRMSSRSATRVWSEMADAWAVVASAHGSSSQVGSGFRLDLKAEDSYCECLRGIGKPLRWDRRVCSFLKPGGLGTQAVKAGPVGTSRDASRSPPVVARTPGLCDEELSSGRSARLPPSAIRRLQHSPRD